jgi:hypothetical protein
MDDYEVWLEEMSSIRQRTQKYMPPLPKKRQRTSAYDGRGRPRKVKVWSPEEVTAENKRRRQKGEL